MKGLILKDLMNFKRYFPTMIFMTIFYAVFAYTTDNSRMITGIITLVYSVLTVSSFAYDDAAKWDRFALSMPVSRKVLVLSKYVLGAILTLFGMSVSILFALAVGWITGVSSAQWSLMEIVVTGLVVAEVAMAYISVMLPLIYTFGVEKSRLLMVLVFAVPMITVMAFMKLGFAMPTEQQLTLLFALSPFVVAGLLAASYNASVRIFAKKEL